MSREREHASGASGGNDVETATAAGGGAGGGAGRRPLQGGRGMGWPAAQTPMGMAPTRGHGATTLVVSPSATPGRVTSYVSNPMGEAKTSSGGGGGDVEMMEEGGGKGRGGEGEGKKEEEEKAEEEESMVMVAAAGLGKATVVVGRGLWSIASWGASKVFNTGEEEEEEEEEKKGE